MNLGLSSAFVGNLVFFARAKPWFMGAALLLITAALVAAFRGGRRPNWRVLAVLMLAVVLVIGSYVLPSYEADILRWLGLR